MYKSKFNIRIKKKLLWGRATLYPNLLIIKVMKQKWIYLGNKVLF